MMASWTIRISPEAEAAARRLRSFADGGALRAIASAMDEQNELTTGHVQQTRLSQRGPESLGVITNRLRSSLRPSKAEVVSNQVISSIGSNVKYLGVHEFGFDETVTVGSHQRKIAHLREGIEVRRFVETGRKVKLGKSRLHEDEETIQGKTITEFHQERLRQIRLSDAKSIKGKMRKERLRLSTVTVRAHQRRMKFPERAPVRRGIEERLPEYGAAISESLIGSLTTDGHG